MEEYIYMAAWMMYSGGCNTFVDVGGMEEEEAQEKVGGSHLRLD